MEGIGVNGDWEFLFQGKELVDGFGYDFHSRGYDQYLGRFWQIDGANQFASGYVGMGNMPTMGVDPDGQWVHLAIGAAIGGVGNLVYQGFNGKLKKPGDYFAAFGIGASAGFVTALTGGAAAGALGLSSTGVAAGLVTGGVGALAGDPIRGFGNAAYFKDPYSLSDYGTGILAGGILGGVAGGGAALFKGKNFWLGTPKLQGTTPFSLSPTKDAINAGFEKGLRGKWLNIEGGDLTFQGADLGNGISRNFGGLEIGQVAGKNNIPIIGRKLDFLFGQATGRLHNLQRSAEMVRRLNSIGIFDNPSGRSYVRSQLVNSFNNPSNVSKSIDGFITKESLLMGPRGGLLMESVWKDNQLISTVLKTKR